MTALRSTTQPKLRPGIRHAPRYLVPALALLLTVLAVGLVAVSPLALDVFGNSPAWTQRSEIGQTYGAAAALLSVLALVGISVSLILQAREAKIAREYASLGNTFPVAANGDRESRLS